MVLYNYQNIFMSNVDGIALFLKQKYNLLQVISVSIFDIKNSKYSSEINHWVIKTKTHTYFLKRYPKSYIKKVHNEIRALHEVENFINVPQIIKTSNGDDYIMTDEGLYIVYNYIHAKNLRNTKIGRDVFLKSLCEIQNCLITLGESEEYYDFSEHAKRFGLELNSILRRIVTTKNAESLHDFTYVSFLRKELEKNKTYYAKIKIKTNLTHGDLMFQNILIKNKTYWVIDWEKSKDYIIIIDTLKSITLATVDRSKDSLGLEVREFLATVVYCFKNIQLDKTQIKIAMDLFYFHLITNTSTLEKIYIDNQDLIHSINQEDFIICKWIQEHKDELQNEINKIFSL